MAKHPNKHIRESDCLADTIRSAIRDVEKAGFRVVRVESDTANVISKINADLLVTQVP